MGTESHLLATSADDVVAAHPIQAGRVQAHKTLDGEGFKIRTLIFDAGAVMREHRAPVPILVQVVSGRVLFRVSGQQHDLHPGGAIQVSPGVLHELEAIAPSHVRLVLMG